jgi:hypothetical protein
MKRTFMTIAAVAALAGGLAACQTATPYQPLRPGYTGAGGYSDVRLEQDRWRVTFEGNSLTSRETVESYLLYRAAELTVAQGYDWFETIERKTDKHTETYADTDPFGRYGYGWHPYWRYYGGGHGWRHWDPFWGDPFWADDIDIQTVEKYEASSEIIMHHGAKPAGDPRAFDARDVTANLGPHIVRPK